MVHKDNTVERYQQVIAVCRDIFAKKMHDYGSAWRILRLSSITDQILIKAQRIRTIQEQGSQKIQDNSLDEFVGIVNYCVMAIIQIQQGCSFDISMSFDEIEPEYARATEECLRLLENKNHDYGEAWRDMRLSSITDIILMKLFRIKQIEDHEGKTWISEGVKANYQDILNYAVLAFIKIKKL